VPTTTTHHPPPTTQTALIHEKLEPGSTAAALHLGRFLREHLHLRGSVAGVSVAAKLPKTMYIRTYYTYLNRGMLLLALDTLNDMRADVGDDSDGESDTDSDGDDAPPAPPPKPADPFAFDMGAFGGGGMMGGRATAPAAEKKEKATSKKKKKKKKKKTKASTATASSTDKKKSVAPPAPAFAAAADPFAFNMSAFGGFGKTPKPAPVEEAVSSDGDSEEDDDGGACVERVLCAVLFCSTWFFSAQRGSLLLHVVFFCFTCAQYLVCAALPLPLHVLLQSDFVWTLSCVS
jgi:hypothetical protein